jgi:hypothetical protein
MKDYLFGAKENKRLLWLAAIATVIQFAVFKYLYPYANYIHGDSFNYLETAYHNFDVNIYLVGYARFLRLFSVLSSSDTLLVAFQYLLLQASALFFLFTLFYFYQPGKVWRIILFCFMMGNPLLLHLGNLISSDGFFLALSFTWFGLLLWIIHRPNNKLIILQALVLFLAFTTRYNALIYPFIAIVAFWLSPLTVRKKVAGVGAGFLLCGLFILYTGSKFKALTGIWQYSPFSGWQFANNAMYTYRYVDSAERKAVPEKFRVLDKMIRTYFDTTRDVRKHPYEAMMASTIYMWSPGTPLIKYKQLQFAKDTAAREVKKWASMGPLYGAYGRHIIKTYPTHFAKYFLWPNAKKYYAPPVEFLENYNNGIDTVPLIAQSFFGYKNSKVSTRLKEKRTVILGFYPILAGAVNVVMLIGLLGFVTLDGLRTRSPFRKGAILAGTVWLVNAGFTIFASAAALRFQAFPILLTTTFGLLLVAWIGKLATVESEAAVPATAAGNQHADQPAAPAKLETLA